LVGFGTLAALNRATGKMIYGSGRHPARRDEHRRRWLLIRCSITDPDDLALYLYAGPAGIPASHTKASLMVCRHGAPPERTGPQPANNESSQLSVLQHLSQ
jgi:hypothetical protein